MNQEIRELEIRRPVAIASAARRRGSQRRQQDGGAKPRKRDVT